LAFYSYGFRKEPYAARTSLRAGWATGAASFRAEYETDFRTENSLVHWTLAAKASGIDIIRFHGLGNEVPLVFADSFYKVRLSQFTFDPSLGLPLGQKASFSFGPLVKYSHTKLVAGRFITTVRPYGVDRFGQVGGRAELKID